MKRIVVLATALLATAALAEERYTNADLDRIYVPGAFTNEDLKALPSIETQEAPAQPLVGARIDTAERDLLFADIRSLEEQREAAASELAYEEEIVRRAYGPGGNAPDRAFFAGYRSKSRGLREALRKEMALLDQQVDSLRWRALRAAVATFR
jgi:hypothetical protein